MHRREAQHDWLLFQGNGELIQYRLRHRVTQSDKFSRGRVTEIHECKGVAG